MKGFTKDKVPSLVGKRTGTKLYTGPGARGLEVHRDPTEVTPRKAGRREFDEGVRKVLTRKDAETDTGIVFERKESRTK